MNTNLKTPNSLSDHHSTLSALANSDHHKELTILIAVFIILNMLSLFYQKRISLNNGEGFDGKSYYELAQDIATASAPATDAPFAARIGLSLIVGILFPNNLMFGFTVLNVIANFLMMILFIIWLRFFIQNWRIRTLVIVIFMIAWHSPIRIVYYEAPDVDHWLFVFLFAGFIGIHKFYSWSHWFAVTYLCIITFLGVLFRDASIIPAFVILFINNPIPTSNNELNFRYILNRLPNITMLLPLICGIIGFIFAQLITVETTSYSILETMVGFAYHKPFPVYILSWFIAFGPLLIVILIDLRHIRNFLMHHQYLLIALLGIAFLGYVGGTATYRLLHWATPIVFLLMALSIEHHQQILRRMPIFCIILIICQSLSQRVFWIIPDYPNDAPRLWPIFSLLGNNVRLFDILGMSGDERIISAMLAEYLVTTVLAILYFVYISNKYDASQHPINTSDVKSKQVG